MKECMCKYIYMFSPHVDFISLAISIATLSCWYAFWAALYFSYDSI